MEIYPYMYILCTCVSSHTIQRQADQVHFYVNPLCGNVKMRRKGDTREICIERFRFPLPFPFPSKEIGLERRSIYISSRKRGSPTLLPSTLLIEWVSSGHMCVQIIFNILFVLRKHASRLSPYFIHIYVGYSLYRLGYRLLRQLLLYFWLHLAHWLAFHSQPTDMVGPKLNSAQLPHNLIMGHGAHSPGCRDPGSQGGEDPEQQGSSTICLAGRQAAFVELVPFPCCHNVAAKVFTLKPFHAGKLWNELAELHPPKGKTLLPEK